MQADEATGRERVGCIGRRDPGAETEDTDQKEGEEERQVASGGRGTPAR